MKPNRNTSAGTVADSSIQPKLQSQAKLLPNPMLCGRLGDWFGFEEKESCTFGQLILLNDNLFIKTAYIKNGNLIKISLQEELIYLKKCTPQEFVNTFRIKFKPLYKTSSLSIIEGHLNDEEFLIWEALIVRGENLCICELSSILGRSKDYTNIILTRMRKNGWILEVGKAAA